MSTAVQKVDGIEPEEASNRKRSRSDSNDSEGGKRRKMPTGNSGTEEEEAVTELEEGAEERVAILDAGAQYGKVRFIHLFVAEGASSTLIYTRVAPP